MATSNTDKVRENRLRRMASRQRLVLHKSPRRDVHAADYGLWRIGDGDDFTLTLDDVEARLTGN